MCLSVMALCPFHPERTERTTLKENIKVSGVHLCPLMSLRSAATAGKRFGDGELVRVGGSKQSHVLCVGDQSLFLLPVDKILRYILI